MENDFYKKKEANNPTFYADDMAQGSRNKSQKSKNNNQIELFIESESGKANHSSACSSNGEWERISNFDLASFGSDSEENFNSEKTPLGMGDSCIKKGERTCKSPNLCRFHFLKKETQYPIKRLKSKSNKPSGSNVNRKEIKNEASTSIFDNIYLSTFSNVDRLVSLGKRGIGLAFDQSSEIFSKKQNQNMSKKITKNDKAGPSNFGNEFSSNNTKKSSITCKKTVQKEDKNNDIASYIKKHSNPSRNYTNISEINYKSKSTCARNNRYPLDQTDGTIVDFISSNTSPIFYNEFGKKRSESCSFTSNSPIPIDYNWNMTPKKFPSNKKSNAAFLKPSNVLLTQNSSEESTCNQKHREHIPISSISSKSRLVFTQLVIISY
ncbi:hypothetical protein AYI70_g7123 [Smittium culicis]|uniref:Uncharacterized protein n=1 Tax=Smittium culicis TaxID=133412 RepID=A0A1R1XM17_9FUNG|nr:hypothetical protein AYI70_g7123 [Smittium culicis]